MDALMVRHKRESLLEISMLLNPVVSVFKFHLKNALTVYLICSAKYRHTHGKKMTAIRSARWRGSMICEGVQSSNILSFCVKKIISQPWLVQKPFFPIPNLFFPSPGVKNSKMSFFGSFQESHSRVPQWKILKQVLSHHFFGSHYISGEVRKNYGAKSQC